jgi:hypothetical protein
MMMWFHPSLSQANNNSNTDASAKATASTPSSLDPVVGVKDDTLGVFPAGLAYAPFPLVPSSPSVSLGTQIGSLPKQRGWRKGGNLLEVLNQSFSQFSGVGEQPIAPKVVSNSLVNITHFSEGFYKGTLPDVLFVWGSDFAVAQALVDEIRFYLQKLNTMGFLLNASNLNNKGKTSVDVVLPAIVLVGGGVWYHRFLGQLQQAIEEVGFSYTEGKQLQQAVLGKICRGAILGLTPSHFAQPADMIDGLDKVQSIVPESQSNTVKMPLIRFKIAGGKHVTQRQVLHSLGRNGAVISIENEGISPAERLELQQLHDQLQQFVLPYAVAEATKHKKRGKTIALEQYQQALSDAIFEMGLNRKAFEAYEKGLVLSVSNLQKQDSLPLKQLPADVQQCLGLELLPHLQVVHQYMNAIGLTDTHGVMALCLAHLSK